MNIFFVSHIQSVNRANLSWMKTYIISKASWHKFFSFYKNIFMADNKDIRDGRDRSKVDGNETYELQYLAENSVFLYRT